MLHSLHDILGYRKLGAHWIPHEISEVQQCHRCAVTQALLDRTKGKVTIFLDESSLWARSYEPNLKRESNEWKHPSSPCPKKVCPTQCAVKVKFNVAYDIDGVILHSKSEGKLCSITFVQSSGENDVTLWYRTPSFFMAMQGNTLLLLSRTSCAAGNGRLCNTHHTHPI